jgi:hypothetical protein
MKRLVRRVQAAFCFDGGLRTVADGLDNLVALHWDLTG